MFYVQLVTQYLVTTEFDDDTVQAIMDEALKYEGWRYVYGGASVIGRMKENQIASLCFR
jgi:hypothetical protein